jgi:hypothetical protein
VIVDSDGAGAPPFAPRLRWVLSVASTAVAAAALLALNALPRADLARSILGESVIAQALAKPQLPRLSLELPPEIAVPLPPGRAVLGDYGPARPAPTVRSYRLRGSGDIIVVVMAPDAPKVIAPNPRPADALAVHGQYALGWTVEATSLSVVRWTENAMTYEISSRTLRPAELARLAESVR